MDSSNMSNASYENSLDKEGECFFEEYFYKFVQYGMPVIYSLLFLFSLSLNAMVLFFIAFRTKHWTPSTTYMLNLSMCDTLYVLTLPLIIYNWIYTWPFGEAVCKICNFLFNANHYGRQYARHIVNSIKAFLGFLLYYDDCITTSQRTE